MSKYILVTIYLTRRPALEGMHGVSVYRGFKVQICCEQFDTKPDNREYPFNFFIKYIHVAYFTGERDVAVVRAFAHGAMGRRIDPSWGGPIELFLVPASAPRLV